ncbi:MAG: glutamine-hydrolyzing carbamoyl-phosphate synthase small subunit [Candidatus Thermoplasmatota archaeon]|nr:glutamine-hydrolyzing carbamoyl-phosphate synthase small subunit [Candidatus Thermoplasmatota archaeon]
MKGVLELEDGTRFHGDLFGKVGYTDGEVVFNTGMVGYVESMTDPSYSGQILVFTYPLIGNYGVPESGRGRFESDRLQVRGIVVTDLIEEHSHWSSTRSLNEWMKSEGIVGISGIDTRELTKLLREKGTMLGRVHPVDERSGDIRVEDPNLSHLVATVSRPGIREHEGDGPHIVIIDCGCKEGIIRSLKSRHCRVTSVPHDHTLEGMKPDGVLISNGPGDPALCRETISTVRKLLECNIPTAGICLGCQIIALAAGARTYKLPFGHRSQNQPCEEVGTKHCIITSQNHGYAIDENTLPKGWEIWFRNLNDRTVEGIKHSSGPFLAVQFHPEASPGPTDPQDFFDRFLEVVGRG